MPEDTPEHRKSVTVRSGDTHAIGDDGTLRNVDQEARDAAAAEAAAAEAAASESRPAPSRRGAPDPLPPLQLTDPNSSDA